jgi:hypothetical protein
VDWVSLGAADCDAKAFTMARWVDEVEGGSQSSFIRNGRGGRVVFSSSYMSSSASDSAYASVRGRLVMPVTSEVFGCFFACDDCEDATYNFEVSDVGKMLMNGAYLAAPAKRGSNRLSCLVWVVARGIHLRSGYM